MSRSRLDRTSPLPLWAQLHRDLLRRVGAGEFDDAFPGEHELTAAYDVSRHTVREALRRLRDDGVIDSARGRGTSVRRTVVEQPLGALYSLVRAVEDAGLEQRSDTLHQGLVRSAEVAGLLGLPADAELFHLERLRYADGVPLAHDAVWLPGDLAGPLLDADFTRAALYDELATRCGVRVTGGAERIGSVCPSDAQRELLAVPADVPVFVVERRTVERATGAGERPVELRRTAIRADRWSVTAAWTSAGYTLGAVAAGT